MGLKITNNPIKIIKSYILSKKIYKISKKKLEQEQMKKLNSNKPKILIVSHPRTGGDGKCP